MTGLSVDSMACRVAVAKASPVGSAIGYSALHLARITGAPAGWIVVFCEGRVDPGQPVLYWYRGPAGGDPGPVAVGGAAPEDIGIDPGREDQVTGAGHPTGDRLPLTDWLRDRGLRVRMLLPCRWQGRLAAVAGFAERPEHPGFSGEAVRLAQAWGPVLAHGIEAVRGTGIGVEAPGSAPFSTLSEREAEIAAMTAAGATNPQIAASLGIAPGTVKSHLHRAFGKLGIASRTSLALMVDQVSPAEPVSPGSDPKPAAGPRRRGSRGTPDRPR